MLIALHKNARTTPAVRAEIAASSESASVLAQLRIPLMADSDSIPIADSIPCDGGHAARVS